MKVVRTKAKYSTRFTYMVVLFGRVCNRIWNKYQSEEIYSSVRMFPLIIRLAVVCGVLHLSLNTFFNFCSFVCVFSMTTFRLDLTVVQKNLLTFVRLILEDWEV